MNIYVIIQEGASTVGAEAWKEPETLLCLPSTAHERLQELKALDDGFSYQLHLAYEQKSPEQLQEELEELTKRYVAAETARLDLADRLAHISRFACELTDAAEPSRLPTARLIAESVQRRLGNLCQGYTVSRLPRSFDSKSVAEEVREDLEANMQLIFPPQETHIVKK